LLKTYIPAAGGTSQDSRLSEGSAKP